MTSQFFDEVAYYRAKDQADRPTRFWGTREGQEARFRAIARHVKLDGMRILDLGSGSGDLLAYALDHSMTPSAYTGVDIVPEFAEEASRRGLPGKFVTADVATSAWSPDPIDFTVANGLFSHRQPNDGWWARYRMITDKMWAWSKKGVALTLISHRSSGSNPEAQYCDPSEILADAQERFGHWTAIDHSYLQNDVAIVIYKTPRDW